MSMMTFDDDERLLLPKEAADYLRDEAANPCQVEVLWRRTGVHQSREPNLLQNALAEGLHSDLLVDQRVRKAGSDRRRAGLISLRPPIDRLDAASRGGVLLFGSRPN
jgi:hypothetical protein